MEIHVDAHLTRATLSRVHHAVYQALRGRARPEVKVYVSRPGPGRWSVFLAGLPEHPLAVCEAIEAALVAGDGPPARRNPR
jgi:hypothetical protein